MVDIERYIGKYLSMLIRSYNPDHYVQMIEYPWRQYAKFFFATLGIALVLFVVTFIPLAITYIGSLPETLQEVQQFEISGSVEADHPVVVLSRPNVVLDLNSTTTRSDNGILITRQGIAYPKYIFFGSDFAPWDDLNDIKQPTETRDRMLFGIVVFMLPSIIFWFAVMSVARLLAAIFILVLLGYLVPRLFKHRLAFSDTVKTAILAVPSLMLIGVGLSPLAPQPLFWWGFLLTCVIFSIGVVLLSERVGHRRHKKYK